MNTAPTTQSEDELRQRIEHIANCIGSPYGEGATYDRDRVQRALDEGLAVTEISHLDDKDKQDFMDDLATLIHARDQALLKSLLAELPPKEEIKLSEYLNTLGEKHAMMLVDWKTGVNQTIDKISSLLTSRLGGKQS